MKYILILAAIIVAVRIDFFLKLIDKASVSSGPTPVEVHESDIRSDRQTISMAEDKNLKQTPKKTFLALLEDFHGSPQAPIRVRALEIFKSHPTMFNLTLDKELESHIFQWRDLLNNNEPEAVNFLHDLMLVLQGENHEMLKRFFSLWMEIDMEKFLAAYSRSRDVNCSVATVFGDNLPEEEKQNEIYQREEAIKQFLTKEKIEPAQKALATNCLLVLGIEIAKFPAKPATEEEPSVDSVPETIPAGVAP